MTTNRISAEAMLRRRCGVFMFLLLEPEICCPVSVIGGGARRGYGWLSPRPPAPGLAFSPSQQERSPRPVVRTGDDRFRATSLLLSNVRNGRKLAQSNGGCSCMVRSIDF